MNETRIVALLLMGVSLEAAGVVRSPAALGRRAAELVDVLRHVQRPPLHGAQADHPENVHSLEPKWVFQARSLEKFEATPLVVDGVLYTVQPPNDIVALDAQTGRIYWA